MIVFNFHMDSEMLDTKCPDVKNLSVSIGNYIMQIICFMFIRNALILFNHCHSELVYGTCAFKCYMHVCKCP